MHHEVWDRRLVGVFRQQGTLGAMHLLCMLHPHMGELHL